MLHHVQNSFNAGAISSYVSARPELEVYQSGCRKMENFIALSYGGARYRPGTEVLERTKNDGPACIYGFDFSTSERHVIEFGVGYLRFYQSGIETAGPILVDGEILEIASPYQLDDLRHLQFAQLNDIVFITHPNHPPYRLSRFALDRWTLEPYPLRNPPFLDVEVDNAMTANGTTGEVTLSTVSDFFDEGHIGAEIEIAHRRTKDDIQQEVEMVQGTDTITILDPRTGETSERTGLVLAQVLAVNDAFTIQSFGTWTANVEVFRRYPGATEWEEYLTFSAADDRNINEGYELGERVDILLAISDFESATSARALISVSDPFLRGRVKVTGVNSPTEATATVLTELAIGTATEWSESAFSDYRGYPRAVTFHGQRLWFGGTISRPQTLWASRIDGYDDFARPFGTDGTADADAPLSLSVFAEQHNRIEWLSSNRALLAGTSAGEFVISGTQQEQIISANDFDIRRQSSNGASPLQALPVDAAVVFIQRQGRRLRKMGYAFENDSYKADDATIYNEHLTRSGILELAFQRQREPIIWGVMGDGRMVGWTYRADQPFFAGYEFTTPGGKVESVATIYGDGDEDEVWLVINRDGIRTIERMRPDQVLAQERGNLDLLWFLDGAREYRGATSSCDQLEHLEGKEVQIFADGAFAGRATVENGEITNPRPAANRTLVGIHYPGEIETMPIEFQTENGTSQGRMKQAGRAVIRVFQSLTGEWFTSQNQASHPFRSLTPQTSIVEARPLEDFDQTLESHPGHSRTITIGVRQTHPYPLTVLSISSRITVTENE